MVNIIGKYKIPSKEILRNRRIFYRLQRKDGESSQNWFNRVQISITGCQFPKFTEYFLIDKFISELKTDEIEHIRSANAWSLIPSLTKTSTDIGKTISESGSTSNEEMPTETIVRTFQYSLKFQIP